LNLRPPGPQRELGGGSQFRGPGFIGVCAYGISCDLLSLLPVDSANPRSGLEPRLEALRGTHRPAELLLKLRIGLEVPRRARLPRQLDAFLGVLALFYSFARAVPYDARVVAVRVEVEHRFDDVLDGLLLLDDFREVAQVLL